MAECAPAEAAPVSTTPETPITPMPIQAGIEAKEIHRRAVASFTTTQRARYEHIFYLRLVDVRGVYTLERYSGMVQYCEANFGYSERMTKDLLRVGEALERFPKLAEAFKRGEIEYSKVREITHVVEPETEEGWLDLARKLNTHEIEREVAAKRKGLKKKKLGTPPAWVLHKFRVLPHEAETIGEALTCLSDLTGGDVGLGKGVLMMATYMLQRIQDEDPKRLPRPLYKIVIHTTPSLDEAHIETDKGPVPISAKEVELVMGSAEVVELDKAIKEAEEALNKEAQQEAAGDEEAAGEAVEPDEEMGEELEKAEEAKSEEAPEKPKEDERVPEEADKGAHAGTPSTSADAAGGAHVGAPSAGVGSDLAPPTSPRLRRHILERDHGHCLVPGCRCRIGLPIHHIEPRSLGGKTEASNLATLCIYHHSLVTDGLLIIEGRAPDKLVFRREDGSLFHPELLSPEQKLALEIPSSPPPPKEEPFKIPAVITAAWWQANKHHFRWSDRKDCYEVV